MYIISKTVKSLGFLNNVQSNSVIIITDIMNKFEAMFFDLNVRCNTLILIVITN